ncbi:hypothetical protein Rctr71_090 [Virus Rctr71]|nr:hypothetical protein Rctr71_090 [Virus Rctr71]
MRPPSRLRVSRFKQQIVSVLNEQVTFVVPQHPEGAWDSEPYDISDGATVTTREYRVPCRLQHGQDGMTIRTYRDIVQVGNVGDVWLQIANENAWIAHLCRDTKGGHALVDGQEIQILEVTPNRVGLPTSTLVKGRYRGSEPS